MSARSGAAGQRPADPDDLLGPIGAEMLPRRRRQAVGLVLDAGPQRLPRSAQHSVAIQDAPPHEPLGGAVPLLLRPTPAAAAHLGHETLPGGDMGDLGLDPADPGQHHGGDVPVAAVLA